MKIIKAPKAASDAWKEQRCVKKANYLGQNGCGAVLALEESDVVVMLYYGTHFAHNYAGFKCPVCGKYGAVNGIPDPIWQRVYKVKKRSQVFDGFDDRRG
jgi:hypothetical protein